MNESMRKRQHSDKKNHSREPFIRRILSISYTLHVMASTNTSSRTAVELLMPEWKQTHFDKCNLANNIERI